MKKTFYIALLTPTFLFSVHSFSVDTSGSKVLLYWEWKMFSYSSWHDFGLRLCSNKCTHHISWYLV